MKRSYLLIMISFLVLSAIWLFGYSPTNVKTGPIVEQGIVDLTNMNWETNRIVELNGKWEFYWQKLLSPSDFTQSNLDMNDTSILYQVVPGEWTMNVNGKTPLPHDGYATYRIRILTPLSAQGKEMGIEIPSIATSYRLWVNGEYKEGNGVVGNNRFEMKPVDYPKIIFFSLKGQTTDLVIQVANYVERKSGLWDSFRFGNADAISFDREKRIAVDLFISGSLFTMGVYHLVLFWQRKLDRAKLYLGLFGVAIGLRTLTTGEVILARFLSNIPWEIQTKIEYLSVSLGAYWLLQFVRACYPKEQKNGIHYILSICLGLYSLFVLLTPARIFTYTMLPSQIVELLAIVYIVCMFMLAYIHKREGADLNLLGLVIFFFAACNDVLFYNHVLNTGDLVPIGMVFFVFMQAIQQSHQFSNSFTRAELLSIELQALNDSLEQKVKDRTQELEISNSSLLDANQELYRMERSRKMLFSNISHELGTPLAVLQAYVKALMDQIDPSKQERFLQIVYDRTIVLKTIIQDLFELSMLETGKIRIDLHSVCLVPLLRKVFEKFELQMKEAGIQHQFLDDTKLDEQSVYARIDSIRIEQALSNLITNALKHTQTGGMIRMIIKQMPSERSSELEYKICIEDTGTGISNDDLPYVFERFYKSHDPHKARVGGTGLGLPICKEIIERHGGRVGVESELDKGSTFFFTLPVVLGLESLKEIV